MIFIKAIKGNKNSDIEMQYLEITITKHAFDRFLFRSNLLDYYNGLSEHKKEHYKNEIETKIINQVKQSKLIGLSGNEEHRVFHRNVFVIDRKRDGLSEKMVVVTVKLTNVGKRQMFSKSFNEEPTGFMETYSDKCPKNIKAI